MPRRAASVVLVRDARASRGVNAVEVFLLERVSTMTFAPDAVVFPGGGVDDRDDAACVPWAGPSPAQWAQCLDVDAAAAGGLVVAAARELFEECGVLLAGPHESEVVADVGGPDLARSRAALAAHETSFAEVLDRRGLVLRSDLLRAHARWVTPEFSPRRYDTFFFAALCPPGQAPDGDTSEAHTAGWFDPAEVLARRERGDAMLLPPTVVTLERVARAAGAASFVDEPPPFARVQPRLEHGPQGPRLVVEVPT